MKWWEAKGWTRDEFLSFLMPGLRGIEQRVGISGTSVEFDADENLLIRNAGDSKVVVRAAEFDSGGWMSHYHPDASTICEEWAASK